MRLPVKVVSEQEYEAWAAKQPSYYMSTIRNSEEDPYTEILFESEISQRKAEFNEKLESALTAESPEEKAFELEHVKFQTGLTELTPLSRYELDNIVEAMAKYPEMRVELAGHTDNTGEEESNQTLSENRAQVVFNYLVEQGVSADRLTARGYGASRPIDTNDTDAGRENNRRTELKIIG
jgi:cytochrome c oxidase subunit 2